MVLMTTTKVIKIGLSRISDNLIFKKRVKERICGFLRIFTYTEDGLFKVRLDYVRVKECPAGLETPIGAINGRKLL